MGVQIAADILPNTVHSPSLNFHAIKCWIFNWSRYNLSIMYLNFRKMQCNEVGGSYHTEKEGLQRVMNFLKKEGLQVDVLVTDQHG